MCVCACCRPRLQAYDDARKNPEISCPAKHVEQMGLKGFYRSCIYKWQKQRVSQKWDLLMAVAPKVANTWKETPNKIRALLGHKLKFDARASRNDNSSTSMVPASLQEIVAQTVVPQFSPTQFFASHVCMYVS